MFEGGKSVTKSHYCQFSCRFRIAGSHICDGVKAFLMRPDEIIALLFVALLQFEEHTGRGLVEIIPGREDRHYFGTTAKNANTETIANNLVEAGRQEVFTENFRETAMRGREYP